MRARAEPRRIRPLYKEGEIDREWVEEGITSEYIFARGIGAADQTLENKTQRMATSRNAAVVSAQYNTLSLLKGVKLEGGRPANRGVAGQKRGRGCPPQADSLFPLLCRSKTPASRLGVK
ncbi:MAG: hypothetical protein HY796_09715 [Elusimicrobia bacterium]|nr:hypothetical protein [Elusimicrobiota bacterium]